LNSLLGGSSTLFEQPVVAEANVTIAPSAPIRITGTAFRMCVPLPRAALDFIDGLIGG
jgi:hypothetical protein